MKNHCKPTAAKIKQIAEEDYAASIEGLPIDEWEPRKEDIIDPKLQENLVVWPPVCSKCVSMNRTCWTCKEAKRVAKRVEKEQAQKLEKQDADRYRRNSAWRKINFKEGCPWGSNKKTATVSGTSTGFVMADGTPVTCPARVSITMFPGAAKNPAASRANGRLAPPPPKLPRCQRCAACVAAGR